MLISSADSYTDHPPLTEGATMVIVVHQTKTKGTSHGRSLKSYMHS